MNQAPHPYQPRKKKAVPPWIFILLGCGCLMFISIAGIISAILIPNFLDALQKAKQKRTVADLRNIGTATMSWMTDQLGSQAAGASQVWDANDYPEISADELQALLVPEYIESLPIQDGWEHAFDFRLDQEEFAERVMALRSPGRDGAWEGDVYRVGAFDPVLYDSDIVWADGFFVRWPQPGASGLGPEASPQDAESFREDEADDESPRGGGAGDAQAQKQTVKDIRDVGTAAMSWLTDQVGAGAAGSAQVVDLTFYSEISAQDLEALLVPQYIHSLPEFDGWDYEFDFRLNDDFMSSQLLAIRSAGADGIIDNEIYQVGSFPADDYDQDIVWTDGFFVRWPKSP